MMIGYILAAVLLIVAAIAAIVAIEIRRPRPPPPVEIDQGAWAPSSAFEIPPPPDRKEQS